MNFACSSQKACSRVSFDGSRLGPAEEIATNAFFIAKTSDVRAWRQHQPPLSDRPIFAVRTLNSTTRKRLPAQDFRKNERSNDRSVGFDDEPRRISVQFAPGDFLIRYSAGIRAEAGRGIADLAEVTPLGNGRGDHVLVKHWHDANREIARDTAPDLEEADRRIF